MKFNTDPEWLMRKAEEKDGCECSAGSSLADLIADVARAERKVQREASVASKFRWFSIGLSFGVVYMLLVDLLVRHG